jgi:hypothetical protein
MTQGTYHYIVPVNNDDEFTWSPTHCSIAWDDKTIRAIQGKLAFARLLSFLRSDLSKICFRFDAVRWLEERDENLNDPPTGLVSEAALGKTYKDTNAKIRDAQVETYWDGDCFKVTGFHARSGVVFFSDPIGFADFKSGQLSV